MSDLTDTLPGKLMTATIPWMAPIQDGIAAVEARLREVSPNQHDALTVAINHLLKAGGKRVRPAICLLSAGIFSADEERSIYLAAGVEMLHTATLVHDDLIDGALLRRGVPTLNADWRPDTSVLAGDYLFARAASFIVHAEDIAIMDVFVKTLMTVLNGEIAQRFSRWQIDRQEYYQRIYAKTAAMFVLAAQAAAMLGKADQDSLAALIEFGRSVGMAFQIVDDLLDLTGTTDQIGKPIGSDLRQGLFTLPLIYYTETHPQDADISALLKEKNGDHPAIPRLIAKVNASGAIEASLSEARSLAAQGQRALAAFPSSTYVAALSSLAESAVARQL